MHNFRVAIVGTGFMAMAHTEGLRRIGIEPLGILGSTPQGSAAGAATLSIGKSYRDYEELLADEAVQAVHITSPNRLHFEHASRALQGGKHVLCEKPLAMSSQESAVLVRLAEESGLVAGVNYNLRFYPLNLEAHHKVAQGELGDIFAINGSYVQDWLLYPTDYNWRVLAAEGGALRAVADIGTHWLDLMQMVTGLKVEAVLADLKIVYPIRQRPRGEVQTFSGQGQQQTATEPIEVETEDSAVILLRFNGGAHGSLWVSQVTAGRKNCLRYEISGSKAAVAWNSERPDELWLGRRDTPNEILLRDPSLVSAVTRKHITFPGGHNEGYGDTFKQCFQSFYSYITVGERSAAPLFPTFSDGQREILLCEAILRSHQEGRWVSVAPE